MKIINKLLFLSFLSLSPWLQAQDIHYSMFDLAPLSLNPAQTGYYEGTFRIGGVYRTQWQGASINTGNFSGFRTPSVYLDLPIASPFVKKNQSHRQWIGAGLYFLNDKVGAGQLNNLNGMIALAYHIGLGAEANTRLSIGVRGGLTQHRIDATKLRFEDGIVQGGGTTYIPGIDNNLADPSASYADFSAGLMLSHRSQSFGYQVGVAANHLTRPKYQFLGNESRLPMGIVASAIFDISVGEKFLIRPLAFYQFMAKAQELNAQVLFGYHLNETKDLTLLFGPGYRLGDAIIGRLGLEWKGLRFGFAYDFNASRLSNNGRAQAFEVGLSYIVRIVREPLIKPILFCPRF